MLKRPLKLLIIALITIFISRCLWAGDWNYTDYMSTPRHKHTATLLTNGKLLITGGGYYSSSWIVIYLCEVYDTSTNTWSSTDSMHTSREWHTATLLPNGKVLVTGGFGGFGYPRSCEIYDTITDSWAITDSLSIRREGHTATLLPNGKVLVVGGGPYISSCEVYDTSTNIWTTTGSLHTSRYGHTATLLQDGSVFVTGGFCPGVSITSHCEIYDTTTGAWSYTDSMKTNREGHTATLLPDGKVLVVGGYGYDNGGNLATFSSCEIYDPLADTWSYMDSMSADRYAHTATLVPNDKLLITGGSHYNGSFWDVLSSCEIYNLSTNTWSDIESMNKQRTGHTATLLSEGKVIVVGGTNETSCEIYTPPTGVEEDREEDRMGYSFIIRNCQDPFGSSVQFEYILPEQEEVKLNIYNIIGERVRMLVNSNQIRGYYEVHWNKIDEAGKKLPGGIYFVRFKAGKFIDTKKFLILE